MGTLIHTNISSHHQRNVAVLISQLFQRYPDDGYEILINTVRGDHNTFESYICIFVEDNSVMRHITALTLKFGDIDKLLCDGLGIPHAEITGVRYSSKERLFTS